MTNSSVMSYWKMSTCALALAFISTHLITTGMARVNYDRNAVVIDGVLQNEEHFVSFSKNLDNATVDGIKQLIGQRMSMEMTRDFSDFVKMAFWQAVLQHGPNGHDFTDIHEVNLNAAQDWWQANFTNYGCYCWPDGKKRISGFGKPLDALDETCFDLYSCYRCVSMQTECAHVSWTDSHYDCQFLQVEDGKIEINCNDPNPCLQSLCECDKRFAHRAEAAIAARIDTNANQFPTGCPRVPHNDNKACCGDWPVVSPYSRDTHCCSSDQRRYTVGEGVGQGGQCDNHTAVPTLDDMYITIGLNANDPTIANHDHNGNHASSDHTHG